MCSFLIISPNGAADVVVFRTVVLSASQDILLQLHLRVWAAINSVVGTFFGVIGRTRIGLSRTFARCFGVGCYF